MSASERARRVRPCIERLEERDVPSFGPMGGEFRVNTYTTGDQGGPKLAMNAAGNYVIAWVSKNQVSPTSDYDIYAQRYNSAGVPQGAEFLVNVTTVGYQGFNGYYSSIAMSAAGDF